jgi:hypothetical protein
MIEGDTRTEDVNQGKPFVQDSLLHKLGQMLRVAAKGACDKRGAIHDGRSNRIDRRLHAAKRRALGLHPTATGRGHLAGGQSVDLVVHHQVSQVNVPAGRVREMVSANSITVAVTARGNDRQLVICHLYTRGYCQGPSVKSVHAVRVEEPGEIGGATDPADGHDLVRPSPQLGADLLQAVQDSEVAAARTPVRVNFSFKVFRL